MSTLQGTYERPFFLFEVLSQFRVNGDTYVRKVDRHASTRLNWYRKMHGNDEGSYHTNSYIMTGQSSCPLR